MHSFLVSQPVRAAVTDVSAGFVACLKDNSPAIPFNQVLARLKDLCISGF